MVRECKKPIHLIVTDVVMPRMSGRELTSRLRELRPGVRVLYMSGYTENLTDVPEVLDAGSGFVQKPFSPEYLAQKVREILDMPAIGSRAVPRPVR
jgi:DNA-binding response OmpR family regulator